MSKEWTADDMDASDERVTWGLWTENHHAAWIRKETVTERCREAEYERAKSANWKHQ